MFDLYVRHSVYVWNNFEFANEQVMINIYDIRYLSENNHRVWVFTLKEVIWLDVTGHMTPKTRRLHINKRSFSTSSWHYLVTVANAIQNDQL